MPDKPLKVYIDGELYDKDDAKISVFDHGLLYGDGVFEGIRSYSGTVFKMDEHLDRLWESAEAILLKIPISKQQMAKDIRDTLAVNGIVDGYVRLVVTRGAGTLGLDPNGCDHPLVIIIADSIELYPPELYKKGLKIVTAARTRNHPTALDPRVKSLNYLNNVLAKVEGMESGCIEALMLNHKGEVAECTGDNIFLIRNGAISTPPDDAGILKGITREVVIGLARDAGIEVAEIPLAMDDVYAADECFLTGTAAEVIPVVEVDQRPIGDGKPGPITGDLMQRFHKLTRS